MQEIFFPLNSLAFLVSSVARAWVSGIFSCLSNFQLPYLRANSIFKKLCFSGTMKLFQRGLLLMEKDFATRGATSCLLEMTSVEDRNETGRVFSFFFYPESVPVQLKILR